MLAVETIGRIRREHFIKGKTIKEIARDLQPGHNSRQSRHSCRHFGLKRAGKAFAVPP